MLAELTSESYSSRRITRKSVAGVTVGEVARNGVVTDACGFNRRQITLEAQGPRVDDSGS